LRLRSIEKRMRRFLIAGCLLVNALPMPAQRLTGEAARNPANLPERNPFATERDVALGRQLFLGRCGPCHGRDGEGGRGAALNTGQYRHGDSDRDMFLTIRNGIANTEMPGTFLADPDVWRLVAFVRRLGAARVSQEKAAGDPRAGRVVYQSKGCPACHAIAGEGGDLGPDLSTAGVRSSLAYLRESIVKPSVDIPPTYRTVTVITLAGAKIRGIHLNEDDYSIQVRDVDGNPRSFLKSELKQIDHENDSLIPSYQWLSPAELENVLAYLNSLRGNLLHGAK
jgi:putative heme-binding domain-containing protein